MAARFRLLGPHNLKTVSGPAYFETGAEIDSGALVDFRCTALMVALDAEAQTLLEAECDRLRAETVSNNTPGTVIGFGATSTLPA